MTTARSSRASARALTLLGFVVLGATRVSAHRVDELLQQAWIAIDADHVRVELALQPGIAIADGLFTAIDADRDGDVSAREQRDYASNVLRAATLQLDDQRTFQLELVTATVAPLAALREGTGVIRIDARVRVPRLADGRHRLLFRNESARTGSVFLANALVPKSQSIAVTAQDRTVDQRELAIAFTVDGRRSMSAVWWVGVMGVLALAVHRVRRSRPWPS